MLILWIASTAERNPDDSVTWTRLQQVKHDWDPTNVFHINHNIRPT